MTELERRLINLIDEFYPTDSLLEFDLAVREAARIGAAIEREQCAQLAVPPGTEEIVSESRTKIAAAIRARSTK